MKFFTSLYISILGTEMCKQMIKKNNKMETE